MAPPSWQELLRAPASERHIVQLYRDEAFMRDAVAAWAAPALERGGGVLLIATDHNVRLVFDALRALGADVDGALAKKRLFVVDAHAMLAGFMVGGLPDAARFRALAADAISRVRAARTNPGAEVRAWGEMVNILWHEGNREAARRLEALWNDVVDAHALRILCSYRVDNLDPGTHEGDLHALCGSHSQLIPERDYEAFDAALNQALIDVLGEDEAMTTRYACARQRSIPTGMPPAQAVLLALKELRPQEARQVVLRMRSQLVG